MQIVFKSALSPINEQLIKNSKTNPAVQKADTSSVNNTKNDKLNDVFKKINLDNKTKKTALFGAVFALLLAILTTFKAKSKK